MKNPTPIERAFLWLTALAAGLTLVVIVLGAFVRLSDAGLGCPDWPGCYGHLVPPSAEHHVAAANTAYPERPVEAPKAWKEMVHRYAASTLGLIIVGLAAIAWRRRQVPGQPVRLPLLLVPLVLLQGALGMWTVTLLLKPLVVTLHLFGGMTILSLLTLSLLRQTGWMAPAQQASLALRRFATFAFVLLCAQLALGAWVSSNYAAVACPDLPTCQGAWWPEADFGEGFVLWRGLGIDYEGGVLDHPARIAIHLAHRLVAVLLTLALLGAACWAWVEGARAGLREWRVLAGLTVAALALQLAIATGMVLTAFPLWLATAHNLGAALLLLAGTALLHGLHGHDRVRS
jgi:cytochrome c oxidase assembly protein subunit 15